MMAAREADGTMLEPRAPGYADKVSGRHCWQWWFIGAGARATQMRRQADAATGRIVEWHFAEKPVADLFRAFAEKNGLSNIIVIYTAPVQP